RDRSRRRALRLRLAHHPPAGRGRGSGHRRRRHLHPGRHPPRGRDRRARGGHACAMREAAGQFRSTHRGEDPPAHPRPPPGSAAPARGSRSRCGFSSRRTPALAYARQLVAEGAVGAIRQIRAQYLQDWLSDADAPMTWRLDKDLAGSGALGDIGAHIIDLAQWVSGQDIAAVSGTLQTVVPTRPAAGTAQGLGGRGDTSGERQEVTVDDLALFTARFASGVLGSFEATRMAQGRKNSMRLEINGSKGSIAFDFERMNELEVYDATAAGGRQGFTRILTTEPEHPYAAHWWPTGHGLGYEHTFTHQIADLV